MLSSSGILPASPSWTKGGGVSPPPSSGSQIWDDRPQEFVSEDAVLIGEFEYIAGNAVPLDGKMSLSELNVLLGDTDLQGNPISFPDHKGDEFERIFITGYDQVSFFPAAQAYPLDGILYEPSLREIYYCSSYPDAVSADNVYSWGFGSTVAIGWELGVPQGNIWETRDEALADFQFNSYWDTTFAAPGAQKLYFDGNDTFYLNDLDVFDNLKQIISGRIVTTGRLGFQWHDGFLIYQILASTLVADDQQVRVNTSPISSGGNQVSEGDRIAIGYLPSQLIP